MAENITQYKAGKALVALLQHHDLKDNAIQQITAAVAELLEEVGCSPSSEGFLDQLICARTCKNGMQNANSLVRVRVPC
jgi:hypothetical protein